MSIQAPQGILNIPNATLRVGKLVLDEIVGADTIMNTVARNTILLVDDTEYTANKNWALKLPNAWAGVFDIKTTGAGKYAEFNFYNEGASSNAQGYNLTFNDTTVELRYDGGSALVSGTVSTVVNTYRKVHLLFERNILSVTVDGTLIFTYTDTSGPRPRVYSTTAGGFLYFFTDGGAIDTLKIVNEKWISDGTSNIAYVGGNLGIGVAAPGSKLSVTGNAYVSSNLEVGTANLFVDTVNSRVGIGTVSPDTLLHLEDSVPILRFVDTDTVVDVNQALGGLEFYSRDSTGDGYPTYELASMKCVNSYNAGSAPDGELTFSTGRNVGTGILERMRINADGNVGIGTNAPSAKLHVEHYGSAIGDFEGIRIANHATNLHSTSRPAYEFVVSDIDAATGIGASRFAIGYRGTTSASRTDRLVIDESGDVGIGTASPEYKLNILTDTNYDGISLRDTTRELLKIAKGTNGAYINMFESGVSKVNISTAGDSYFIGGNVGIGTNAPGATLQVAGSGIKSSGYVTTNGIATTIAYNSWVNIIDFRSYTYGRRRNFIQGYRNGLSLAGNATFFPVTDTANWACTLTQEFNYGGVEFRVMNGYIQAKQAWYDGSSNQIIFSVIALG